MLKSGRKIDSDYDGMLSDQQFFEERYIVKHDEDSDIKKLGLSSEQMNNSLISYSVNQSLLN